MQRPIVQMNSDNHSVNNNPCSSVEVYIWTIVVLLYDLCEM